MFSALPVSSYGMASPEMTEEELDSILMSASQQYEEEAEEEMLLMASQQYEETFSQLDVDKIITTPASTSESSRFGPVVNLKEIVKESIPSKTRQQTKWCRDTWDAWHSHRVKIATAPQDVPPRLLNMDNQQLDYWLSRFLTEVRRVDGREYHGESLYSLLCGLQRHLRSAKPGLSVDFLSGDEFHSVRSVLNAKMKLLKKSGVGVSKKQAETITYNEEDILWEKGFLGESSPQVLLDSMVWMSGLFFALRSGAEHRTLTWDQLECRDDTIIYREGYSKNRQGGLAQRHDSEKVVHHYKNERDPSRCFVRLFCKYRSLCPKDVTAFYLTPLKKLKENQWYGKNPVGHNTLTKTVSRLCKLAGISGFKTNHSLRASYCCHSPIP